MLQSKLNTIYNKAVEMVLAANIPLEPERITKVVLNTRAKKRWGQCRRLPNGNCEININADLVEQSTDGTLNTIIHELLHTLKDTKGHDSNWNRYARIINNKYGIDIKRTSSADEKGVKRNITKVEYKYILQCNHCNQKIKRQKKSKIVNHPEWFKCGLCGGSFKRVV
jgi:predicted SprT family Zn-dependent metalloprotease